MHKILMLCGLAGAVMLSVPGAEAKCPPGAPCPVSLACANPGSHQDVAKTPTITNNTLKTLPQGKLLYWTAAQGTKVIDNGEIQLDTPLAPNKHVQGLGSPGQVYTCKAYYYP